MVSAKRMTYVLALLPASWAAPDAPRYKKHWHGWHNMQNFFPFGDSYTTTGFDLSSTQPTPGNPLGNPAYPGSTSSNGPNWVGYLTAKYNQSFIETYNMAYGGAVVSSDLVRPFLPTVDFRQQVNDEFIPYYVQRNTSSWTPDNSLFAFFFGINDVNISYGQRNTTLNRNIFVVYRSLIHQLYQVGARNFLFLNVPPISLAPTARQKGADEAVLEELDIEDFNYHLAAMASTFAHTHRDTTVFHFNTYAIFAAVLADPAVFNQTAMYKNTTDFCTAYQNGTPAEDTFYPNCSIPVNQYFWLNNIHPTYPMHEVMAQQISRSLQGGASVRSYLVRWVDVKSGHTISWSIQPHKKSINFGIFKHPGSGIAPTPKLPSSTFEVPPTPGVRPADGAHDTSQAETSPSAAIEKLKGIGLKLVLWHGTCDANQVTSGKYDVPEKGGGMYALVFDNTFAKQFSKTATFVLLTYPTDSAPQSNHQVHHFQTTSSSSVGNIKTRSRSRQKLESPDSSESIPRSDQSVEQTDGLTVPKPHKTELGESSTSSTFYTGILHKRRRKRHQGYARRFFSLDFTSSTLSYYHDRHTLALRGAVPLSLAAIGASGATREISIDSGAEVWHLRAPNQKEFEAWKNALESASRVSANRASSQPGGGLEALKGRQAGLRVNVNDEREWIKVESLVERVAATREIACRLAKDTDPKYLPLGTPNSVLGSNLDMNRVEPSSGEASPVEHVINDDFPQNGERRPFWKRKASGGRPSPGLFSQRSVSAQPTISTPRSLSISAERISVPFPRQSQLLRSFPEDGLHERCMSMLEELDAVVADFKTLITESRQRRAPVSALSPVVDLETSRMSLDSQRTDEFFDAEGGDGSQIFNIQPESDDEAEPTDRGFHTPERDVSSTSEIEDDDSSERSTVAEGTTLSTFPVKAKNLTPLPLPPRERRKTVPCPTVSPPSLIGFLRKNVGKDLSTISMPVSANEPISLLQKVAEQMEHSNLLDEACNESLTSIERLLHIAAFAISSYAALRVKERGLRKPFNPMLGETFELVREDKHFRFLAEKISHRPVRLAYQAESDKWSLAQSPLPTQKFWGKSAELITEGRTRVILHGTGDRFSWTPATCFLRNIIAGEKYIEPVGTMTITNEARGEHALVTFKAKGLFSGRGEDVVVQTVDAAGAPHPLGLAGKWTAALALTEHGVPVPLPRGRPLWTVGALAPDAPRRYGFTAFAAELNELLPGEAAAIAPTDSRFRPDQRAAEEGDVEAAEAFKARLEDGQRERRRVLDEAGGEWSPMWFARVEGAEGEEVWSLKGGREGYWERRARGDWRGCVDVLGV